jgi:hypothetical protein
MWLHINFHIVTTETLMMKNLTNYSIFYCTISSFRRYVNEIFVLLECYAALIHQPTLRKTPNERVSLINPSLYYLFMHNCTNDIRCTAGYTKHTFPYTYDNSKLLPVVINGLHTKYLQTQFQHYLDRHRFDLRRYFIATTKLSMEPFMLQILLLITSPPFPIINENNWKRFRFEKKKAEEIIKLNSIYGT